MTTDSAPVERLDLSALEFWERPLGERTAAFAALRALEHPEFFPEMRVPFVPMGKGYWALVRHADVTEASRHQDIFSSEPSATTIPNLPAYMSRFFGSLINMDDPRHAKIRRIVSRAFTPKMLAKTEDDVRRRAARIVDELLASGPGDFVEKVAVRLPVEVICDMLGIPERDYARVIARTNVILGNTDAEYTGVSPGKIDRLSMGRALLKIIWAARDLHRLAAGLGRERVKNPTGDLTSALVNANVDGERLTTRELGSFFLLLVVAGNETTRTSLSHALKLFTDFPDQRRLLLEDFDTRIGGAVEEIVRYSTPVIFMRRNVTRDHEMNGHTYKAGDKVLLFYNSANRDDAVFADPDTFDITRSPNPHVGFGGPGPHFCLGANLARREITIMLEELFTRVPDIRAAGEPDRLLSGFINGYKRLPCTFTTS
ncbi:cytochrome P450 [Actinomadura sp. DC4]|uniref:cytochrome P450 n=1 Tax=Actinomadura sp. DC4 TaxID=3055069 RepID=UPI0025B15396|nr:cytochrome P450 [Actinomadura sp. DC4]MDN3351116.1 cytochrome P450 [Actinomadura sp. DC4]